MEAQAAVATRVFADRLAAAVVERRSQLVVGLDPQLDLLPVELRGDAHTGREAAATAFSRFCRGLIDAVCPYCVGVKPQSAFFEALGADGVRAFEEVCEYAATAGLVVIGDVKRGDIGSTARAYASAYLEPRGDGPPLVDAVTVNPYLGRDSLEPFVSECRRSGRGIFCLVKTSNPGGVDIQDLKLTDGTLVWHQVAKMVAELAETGVGDCGLSSVGAVVGATYPRAVSAARKLMPQSILLLLGVGAQGATPADVARAFTSGPASALVSVSRSINYAYRAGGGDWRTAAAAEAARLRAEIWRASGW
jgi:orotidine-5'-phosphate decarboxylase